MGSACSRGNNNTAERLDKQEIDERKKKDAEEKKAPGSRQVTDPGFNPDYANEIDVEADHHRKPPRHSGAS